MNKKVGEYIESHKLALWIAACYVGFGTLAVCSVYPADIFYGSWSLWGLLITFPVTIVSFGYRYAEADTIYPVFIIQFIMFLLTFLILSSFIARKKKVTD
jgi:hypothetical protein